MTTVYSNLGLGLLGTIITPDATLPVDVSALWLEAAKTLWLTGGTSCQIQYSTDNGSTWSSGGIASDFPNGSTNRVYIYSYVNLPAGTLIRGTVITGALTVLNITMGYDI